MYDDACKNGHDMLHEQKQYENQRVKDLENKLSMKELDNETWEFLHDKIRDLESKLETIKEISNV